MRFEDSKIPNDVPRSDVPNFRKSFSRRAGALDYTAVPLCRKQSIEDFTILELTLAVHFRSDNRCAVYLFHVPTLHTTAQPRARKRQFELQIHVHACQALYHCYTLAKWRRYIRGNNSSLPSEKTPLLVDVATDQSDEQRSPHEFPLQPSDPSPEYILSDILEMIYEMIEDTAFVQVDETSVS